MNPPQHLIAMTLLAVVSLPLLAQSNGCSLTLPAEFTITVAQGDDTKPPTQEPPQDGEGEFRDDEGDSEIELNAVLLGTGPEHGDARFRQRGARLRLKVEVEDAQPGGIFEVVVDGFVFGELTIGAFGGGEVEFDTNIEPQHAPWPASFTGSIQPGVEIIVGPVSGVF